MPISYISAPEYHAIKALSAGMVWTFDSECPLKAWLKSPWNPDRQPENSAHFDIGTAAHLAVLEPNLLAERVMVHEFSAYRSNAAKATRDEARDAGKIPLRADEWVVVEGIQKALKRHPIARRLFRDGSAEISLTWDWNGVPCKCRPDYLAADHSYVVDLKTAISAHPKAVARKALNEGWFVRASWYLPGIRDVTGDLPEKYLFVVVEKEAPHLIEVFELDTRALIYGEQIIGRTMRQVTECLASDIWPSYGTDGITEISLPRWSEFDRAEREEAGEFNQ